MTEYDSQRDSSGDLIIGIILAAGAIVVGSVLVARVEARRRVARRVAKIEKELADRQADARAEINTEREEGASVTTKPRCRWCKDSLDCIMCRGSGTIEGGDNPDFVGSVIGSLTGGSTTKCWACKGSGVCSEC